MTYSNLSKIATKFRTKGNVTGNFGLPRVKANSPLNDIGVTNAKVVKCTTQTEYLNRLYYAFDNTTDEKLRRFIYTEIRQILIQTNKW
jgi:hypothetical protein